jgi:aconitate hydratase
MTTEGATMIDVRQRLRLPSGGSGTYYSLPLLETQGVGRLSRLPVSLRVILESVVRHPGDRHTRDQDVEVLARWQPNGARTAEVPFVVGEVAPTTELRKWFGHRVER